MRRSSVLEKLIEKAARINPKARKALQAKKKEIDIHSLKKGNVKSLVLALMETYPLADPDYAYETASIAIRYGDVQLSADFQKNYLCARSIEREIGRTDLTDKCRLDYFIRLNCAYDRYLKAASKIDSLMARSIGKNPPGYN